MDGRTLNALVNSNTGNLGMIPWACCGTDGPASLMLTLSSILGAAPNRIIIRDPDSERVFGYRLRLTNVDRWKLQIIQFFPT